MNIEEVLHKIREEVQGAVAPLARTLEMDPWNDSSGIGARPHRVHHADGVAPPSFPWGSTYTFGITQTAPNKLKVWNGKLRRWGDQVYTASNAEVTFTGDGDQYIIWRWSTGSGLEIVTTPQTNWPAESDSTYIYGVVHKVNLTSGAFTLLDSVQTGIINAPIFSAAGA